MLQGYVFSTSCQSAGMLLSDAEKCRAALYAFLKKDLPVLPKKDLIRIVLWISTIHEDHTMNTTASVPEHHVRQRAFELWEQRGNPEGYEAEFWLQAERELKGDEKNSVDSANAPAARSGSGSDGPV